MHSTQFTRLARAADNNAWEVVAFVERPPSQGCYPSAWVICKRDHAPHSDREYLLTMGVMPDGHLETGDHGESVPPPAFFTSSRYDMDWPEATAALAMEVGQDVRIYA